MRKTLPAILLLLLFAVTRAQQPGTTGYKITSLDSLSDEDVALLEEYRDSFLLEVEDIKAAMLYKKRKPIDTTVALMNRSSHAEISFNVTGPILSNGRSTGLTGAMLSPSVMYYHKLGFYAVLGLNFFTDSTMRASAKVPSMYISPGFNRTFFKRWTFSTGYARSFIFYGTDIKTQNYSFPASDFQKGLLNNTLFMYNSYNFWQYITLGLSVAASWSSNLTGKKYTTGPLGRRLYYKDLTRKSGQAYSINVGLVLRKDFAFYNVLGAKVFTISPDFCLFFGHDNNTLITRAISRPGLKIDSDKFFGLLNAEPGFSLDWRIRNFEIFGAFHCAIPFNEYDSDTGTRVKNPKKYYPYGEGGIKYLFRIKPTPKSPKGDLKGKKL